MMFEHSLRSMVLWTSWNWVLKRVYILRWWSGVPTISQLGYAIRALHLCSHWYFGQHKSGYTPKYWLVYVTAKIYETKLYRLTMHSMQNQLESITWPRFGYSWLFSSYFVWDCPKRCPWSKLSETTKDINPFWSITTPSRHGRCETNPAEGKLGW
jgi:hypothetical protein